MNPNHVIGNIFSTQLMDDNFSGDIAALNHYVTETIFATKWNDVVIHTTENACWIAWEAFIEWIKQQLERRLYDMSDHDLRELVGDWFAAVFGDHHIALHPTINYINIKRENAQKEKEEDTMKTITINENTETEREELICSECGCIITDDDYEEIDGEIVCRDCVNREFVQCCQCDEWVRRDDATDVDGDWYCESCRDDNCFLCEVCGEWHHKDEENWIENEEISVCDNCLDLYFTRCERCGEYERDGDICEVTVNDRGRTENWCQSCVEDYTWTCAECGGLFSYDIDHEEHDYGDYICCNCMDDGVDTGSIETWRSPTTRQGYCFKPAPYFCATDAERSAAGSDWARNIVFYGFELEIDRSDTNVSINDTVFGIVKHLPSTYCKKDCSLDLGGDYSGIEIVSHPATLAWYEAHKQDFEACFDDLTENGWLSHNAGTCGLHVHISLHALERQNPFAVHNMLFLFDRFWNNLVKFSRRTESQLDRWACRYSTARGTYENIKDMAKRDRNRYMAINLQNDHTVELRMFRGTLNIESFFATLQLVDTIVKRCIEIGKDASRIQTITWDEFVASDHAELNAYLERRGLKGATAEDAQPIEVHEDEYPVGCRVRVNDNYYIRELRGLTGVVVGRNHIFSTDFAVRMDCPESIKCDVCHDCGGLTPLFDGRWFNLNEVTIIPAE